MEFLFRQAAQGSTELWKGHSIYAPDGTTVMLPNAHSIEEKFPIRKINGKKEFYPRARLLCAINVLTGQPTHARVDPYKVSEQAQLSQMLDQFKAGDILVMDRGFQSQNLWKKMDQSGLYFIARVRANQKYDTGTASELLKSKKREMIVTKNGLTVRYIVKRTKRKIIVIATNLIDNKKYPRKQLLDLYQKRWTIETAFRRLKQTIKLMQFHSRSYNGIMQEIFACLLMSAIVSGLIYLSAKSKPLASDQQINFTAACAAIWRNQHLFIEGCGRLTKRLISLLLKEIRHFIQKIRPNRKYPRFSKQPENKWIKLRRAGNHTRKDHKQLANAAS